MNIFIVSYDILQKNEGEYDRIWASLDELDSQKVQKSVYLVAVADEMTQDELYRRIKKQLGIGDSLLVAEITTRPKVSKEKIKTNQWLDELDELDKHFV